MPRTWLACLLLSLLATAGLAEDEPPVELRVLGLLYRHDVVSAFVLPGEPITIQATKPGYSLETEGARILAKEDGSWSWYPPKEPGLHQAELKSTDGKQRVRLNAFVMVPADRVVRGSLNGYRIGEYPDRPLKDSRAYVNPRGFVEVTKENEDTPLTPRFRLKQFLCKQPGGYPKYVVLNERLLLKLERILDALERRGLRSETLHVMSGYRTPFYNAAIENVRYSQHVFGGAADVFVDRDSNGMMDDVNGDGEISREDARRLFEIVDALDRQPGAELIGGLGPYGGTKAHGPFVHVDVRGTAARWGY